MATTVSDKFVRFENNLESPAKNGFEITPSTSEATYYLDTPTRALYIGCGAELGDTTANVLVQLVANSTHPTANLHLIQVSVGSVLPLRVAAVHNSMPDGLTYGTTAKHIIGLY